jgi:diguanylate cyclase (GGDEF)-like protein/PAS domain S-box-containing protein
MGSIGAAGWRRTIGWALLFVATALVGRATRVDHLPMALVWPAAGVGILWYLLTDEARRWRVEMPVLAVASVGVNLATGASFGLAVMFAAANVFNASVGATTFARLSPHADELRNNRGTLALGGAALAGGLASAPASVAILAGQAGTGLTSTAAIWVLRYTASNAVVMAVALTWRARWADRRRRRADGLEPGLAELGAIIAASVVVHHIVFSLPGEGSFSFFTLPAIVLVGLRLGPAWTTTHGLLVATIGVVHTIAGRGPFGELPPTSRVVVVQVFIAVSGLVGLALSLEVRQRRTALAMAHRRGDALERTMRAAVVGSALVSLSPRSRGEIRYANPALERWWGGREQRSLVGRSWTDLVDPADERAFRRVLDQLGWGVLDVWNGELRHRVATGEERFCQVAAARLHLPADDGGALDESVANVQLVDITKRKSLEARLLHQALHDQLTGLPNRALLSERIDHALASAGRTGRSLALLFFDLDHFKRVNDSLGHAAGDHVLTTVASRLSDSVRPGDTVARIGGDEFVVCCPGLDAPDDAADVADRILRAVGRPVTVDGRQLTIGVSVGVTIARPGAAAADLLRESDTAMYEAKSSGRGRIEFFADPLFHRAQRGLELEDELRRALTERQFVLHHQPIVDIRTGRVVAVEALVRWEHPTQGLLLPGAWLDVAETSGLMSELGLHILHEAFGQWPSVTSVHGDDLSLHVNVSAAQLRSGGIADTIERALASTAMPADRVVLELTETQLVTIDDSLVAELQHVRAGGVRLAADDFGTGYSSLAQLASLPIDEVKIDRRFVAVMGTEPRSRAIVHGVVAMARAMDLTVIAEGVETEDTAALLAAAGCTLGQGFLWGRPRRIIDLRDGVEDAVDVRGSPRPTA